MKKYLLMIAALLLNAVTVFAQQNNSSNEKNNALNFDGVNDYVNIAHTAALSPPKVTLECWVKPANINRYSGLVTKEPVGSSSQIGYGFRQRADNTFWFNIAREGYSAVAISTTHIVAGTWYHLAGTFNGTTIKLYVNGILEDTTTTSLAINSTADLKIGILNSLGEAYRGNIDEVRVWDVVRTQAEIQADMLGAICGDTSGLVAYYPFNEGIAGGNNAGVTTADDVSGNNNDGTLYNFALTGATSNWVQGGPGLSDSVTVYLDADNDKYGNAALSLKTTACDIPAGYVLDSTDCNDANASINPSTREICNGIDDNCNGLIDDVSGLTTTNITAKTATFNWDKLPGSRFYVIKYRRLEDTTWRKVPVTAPVISITITGLRPNSKYVWKIRSHCDGQYGDFSAPIRFTTAAALSVNQPAEESVKVTVQDISVYPNPVTGNVLNLHITNASANNYQLSITDMQGRVLINQNLLLNGSSNRTIDVAALPKGVYILKVINNKNEQQQIKFVKAN